MQMPWRGWSVRLTRVAAAAASSASNASTDIKKSPGNCHVQEVQEPTNDAVEHETRVFRFRAYPVTFGVGKLRPTLHRPLCEVADSKIIEDWGSWHDRGLLEQLGTPSYTPKVS